MATQKIALVVEDDLSISSAYARVLTSLDYRVYEANSLAQAVSQVNDLRPHVVLLDMMLPDGNGLELLRKHTVREKDSPRFIIITGDSRQDIAIDCLRAKADDFLTKPITLEQLRGSIDQLKLNAPPANDHINPPAQNPTCSSSALSDSIALIGSSDAAQKLRMAVSHCARSAFNTIVRGGIGCEKAILTRSIHHQSKRSGQHIVIHGSEMTNQGELFQLLNDTADGTLVIDDVASLSLQLQTLLATHLRKIQHTSNISNRSTSGNRPARVIATMHCDSQYTAAQEMIDPDLYHWLAQFIINVPCLRKRKKDIRPIANALTKVMNTEHQSIKAFDQASMSALENYSWPGNLRELRNVVGQCYTSGSQIIKVDKNFIANDKQAAIDEQHGLTAFVGKTFWETEKILLFATLDTVGGDKKAAAKMLGISLKTLYNRMKAYS